MEVQKTWSIPIEKDGYTGDFFIVFPDDLINQLGWKIGDTLTWDDSKNGSFVVRNNDAEKRLTEVDCCNPDNPVSCDCKR